MAPVEHSETLDLVTDDALEQAQQLSGFLGLDTVVDNDDYYEEEGEEEAEGSEEPASPAGGMDLDDLLAESLEQRNRAKQHKIDLRNLRKSRDQALPREDKKAAELRVLEWELTHVWRTVCRIERFDVYTCKRCLRQQTIYNGSWLEQVNDKLHCKRLVRLPRLDDLQAFSDMAHFTLSQLPVRRVDTLLSCEECAECTAAERQTYSPSISF